LHFYSILLRKKRIISEEDPEGRKQPVKLPGGGGKSQ